MNRVKVGMGLVFASTLTFSLATGPADAFAQSRQASQVREVPVRGLGGIAKVGRDRRGRQTIYYNPRTCRRLGPDLCSFFRAHEYAHVRLNHLGRGVPTRQAEREADVWAARNSSPRANRAAVEYFAKGRGGSLRHGTSKSRARRVASAASSRIRPNNRRRVYGPFTR